METRALAGSCLLCEGWDRPEARRPDLCSLASLAVEADRGGRLPRVPPPHPGRNATHGRILGSARRCRQFQGAIRVTPYHDPCRAIRLVLKGVPAVLSSGAGLALLSALLFGASTPLAKLLLRESDPWMLAGLLYLGSGLGLIALKAAGRALGSGARREAAIRGADWIWLALATLAGGVVGPVLLMVGLAHTAATTTALLLNLEGVLTALLAWFVFRENFDRRIALGMAAIIAGGFVLDRKSTRLNS